MKNILIAAAISGMMFAANAEESTTSEKSEDKKPAKAEKKAVKKADDKATKKADGKATKKADDKAVKADDGKKVHCMGINSCKGKSECAVDGAHGCSGANECKGKGWITVTMKECNEKKGKVVN